MHLLRPLFVVAVVAALGLSVIALRPQAEETDAPGPPKVSESELQTFVGVYGAMQMDHDLTIEQAVEPYQLSVEAFRQLERRVQSDQRFIDKARQALLARVQNRSPFGGGPTPTPTPILTEPSHTPKPRGQRAH